MPCLYRKIINVVSLDFSLKFMATNSTEIRVGYELTNEIIFRIH